MNAPVEQRLRRLPELEPPVDAWQRVRQGAKRERRAALWCRVRPLALGSVLLTAMAALAALLVTLQEFAPGAPAVPVVRPQVNGPMPEVMRLQAKSRALESMLQSLPGPPQLVRAEDAAAIAELEDRIAHVDWALTRSTARDTELPAAPSLWRERVDLMNQLVRVRYVEAGVSAY